MNRPIVVPLDGSAFAARALPLALSVAARSGACLHLVRVYEPNTAPRRLMMRGPVETGAAYEDRRLRTTAVRYLEDVGQQSLRDLGDGRVAWELLEGEPANALAAYGTRVGAGLVVMSTRRRSFVERLVEPGTTEQVLRRSGIPVLAVDGGAEGSSDRWASAFERIVVPVDGTDHSLEVLSHALAVGVPGWTRYTLVRVVPPSYVGDHGKMSFPNIDPAVWDPDLGEQARRDLDRQARVVRSRGFEVDVRMEPSLRPAEAIVRVAAEIGADLIALTTRPRSLATRLLFGSVATKVARSATSPVLVYCPRRSEGRDAVGRSAGAQPSLSVAR